jgi:archaellum component FlaC
MFDANVYALICRSVSQVDQIKELQSENLRQQLAIAALKAANDEQTKALSDCAETIATLERQIRCLKTQVEELERGGDRS